MSAFSSPLHFLPPLSPRRATSPIMSPSRRIRSAGSSSEDTHLRDLSPHTTMRAFTEKPMPYDTSLEEYKIFACINNLTPAEKDLGMRVAKAAEKLKSWCEEIGQWGWTGTFDQPTEEYKENRRRSLESRIREHVKDSDTVGEIGPLEYWGSLLSVEVVAHETRLDEISEELLELDIEELKEHVLDIHGPNKSRPSSAGYGAARTRQGYTPMDDFSFLITQTLLSALPHHFQLKDRLSTWTARVSVLREAPTYLSDLKMAQKAMRLGWDAVEPPTDISDAAFNNWREAVDTISGVLQGKVSNLGKRLDQMLDTLEGREDCLPNSWIDVFEGVEADYGHWAHESRRRIIEFDVKRRAELKQAIAQGGDASEGSNLHSDVGDTSTPVNVNKETTTDDTTLPSTVPETNGLALRTITAIKTVVPQEPIQSSGSTTDASSQRVASSPTNESDFEEGDTVVRNEVDDLEKVIHSEPEPVSVAIRGGGEEDAVVHNELDDLEEEVHGEPEPVSVVIRDGEEDDTVVHNELDDLEEEVDGEPEPVSVVLNGGEEEDTVAPLQRPQTPRSRSGSIDSISSSRSFASSPPSALEESPSVRKSTNRQARAPRPALNAAMAKRRQVKIENDSSVDSMPPWPPSQFSNHLPHNADDLDRKISDILTTIPAHIRLTTRPETNTPETRSGRGVANKRSKGYLRAARSISGMKSPELTLSPAKQDFDSANANSGRRSTAAMRPDNDIKLYHLTQPGKEHPVKLFIRRVGENGERVMVRVGGGWADLGEYLRQYAEHHGRRTVSEGKFEILGLEIKSADASSPRPESSMSKRDRPISGGASTSPPSTTPQKSASVGLEISKDGTANPNMPITAGTPAGAHNDTSTPSTTSSRHSWMGDEVGLAGPKAKKLDLSGEKQAWFEGMMKQARTVSGNLPNSSKPDPHHTDRAESRSESRSSVRKSDFGDLGKVGGTKRVFLRGGVLSEH